MKKLLLLILILIFINCSNKKQEQPINKEATIDKSEVLDSKAENIDKELTALYDSVSVSFYGESSEKYLPLFQEKLETYLADSLTFYNELDSLSSRIRILTSKDGLVKIYSYDDMSGGSMRYDQSYIQYKADDIIHYKMMEDYGLVSDIYDFKYQDKPYYLVISNAKCGGNCGSTNLRIYLLEGDNIVQTGKLFPKDRFNNKESENGYVDGDIFTIHKYSFGVLTYNFEELRFDSDKRIVSYDEWNVEDKTKGDRISFELKEY